MSDVTLDQNGASVSFRGSRLSRAASCVFLVLDLGSGPVGTSGRPWRQVKNSTNKLGRVSYIPTSQTCRRHNRAALSQVQACACQFEVHHQVRNASCSLCVSRTNLCNSFWTWARSGTEELLQLAPDLKQSVPRSSTKRLTRGAHAQAGDTIIMTRESPLLLKVPTRSWLWWEAGGGELTFHPVSHPNSKH